MFLKRIELQGFKSFADKTILEFEHEVSGVVGPNGCGKSNVNDAIRWVLGEQSAKSLRGSNMSDVIFSGSAQRKAVNMAQVTLVFDNSKKHFDIAYDEVSITRRLHRNSGDAEYLINNTPCRLKDVVDLVMDSGLGRDSLSVISQGNIQSFVESKPEDRRALFEEAAGVAKYKKRKNESLAKLKRTEENLLRVEDIVEELENRVGPLKRQAHKANIYLEKKQQLENIEIAVIVDEVELYTNRIEALRDQVFKNDSQMAIAETTIQVEDQRNETDRHEMKQLDQEVHQLQNDFMKIVNEISAFDARKVEIEEKRKYTLEHASGTKRLEELKQMVAEAKYEYDDRLKREQDLNVENELKRNQIELDEREIAEIRQTYNGVKAYINTLSNRKEILNNLIKSPFNHQLGVKTVMEAKASLYGIHGVVSQLLLAKVGYEEALSSALGGALYHIISEDEDCARNAISYLKKNQSGRATFLPLSVLKQRNIQASDLVVANNTGGFLGCAVDFINCDDKFRLVGEALLGNVLICEKLIHANELARRLHFKYKIVTMDGEIVHKGGSMTGGKIKDAYSPLTLTKELNQVEQHLVDQQILLDEVSPKLNQLNNRLQENKEILMQLQLDIAKIHPVVEVKRAKYEKLQDEYGTLEPNDQEAVVAVENDLIVALSKAHTRKDAIESDLQMKRERRFKLSREIEKRDVNIREVRRELSSLQKLARENELEKVKCETNLDNLLSRLASVYEMTYEHALTLDRPDIDLQEARSEVLRLRSEITRLGNVNLDAPKEYEEVAERYEHLKQQRDELIDAQNKILHAIDEMDEVMKKQFIEMFDKINEQLKETFRALFGGGKAHLYLSDPSDILGSGIEIDVQPTGKSIVNMRSMSGGEKALLAMSVLFAILRARVIPLCIFDEVEAALDQANVERFARYVSNFRGESQFIIVTHRPGTMAQCDALYGVTMQKDGVSKFLKVKLKEAVASIDTVEA